MDANRRAELIQQVYASEGWREVFAPLLIERKRAMEYALRNPSLLHKHAIPDDYARGQLDLAEFLLEHPKMIAETDQMASEEDLLAQKREMLYDALGELGYGSGNVPL